MLSFAVTAPGLDGIIERYLKDRRECIYVCMHVGMQRKKKRGEKERKWIDKPIVKCLI